MPTFFLKADIQNYQPQNIADVNWILTNYGVNENLKLFRSYTPRPVSRAFMGVDDKYCKNPTLFAKNLTSQSIVASLCNSIIKEAMYGKFLGIYLSFSQSCDATFLAESLSKRLPQDLSLFVNVSHLSFVPPRCTPVLAPSFERGYANQLTSFCEKNAGKKLAVELSPEAVLFTLPDLDQSPTQLAAPFVPSLCEQKGSTIFYDKVHLCRYATLWQDAKPAVCLFDTAETYLNKWSLVQNTPDISFVLIDYAVTAPLFDPLLHDLFCAVQTS